MKFFISNLKRWLGDWCGIEPTNLWKVIQVSSNKKFCLNSYNYKALFCLWIKSAGPIFAHTEQSVDLSPQKGAWHWMRWLSATGTSPLSKGDWAMRCSRHMWFYSCTFTSQHLSFNGTTPESWGLASFGSVSSQPIILHRNEYWLRARVNEMGQGWGGMDWAFGIRRCKLLY